MKLQTKFFALTLAWLLASCKSPKPEFIPKPTGPCPEFVSGALQFAPAGIPPRQVQIWMSDAARTLDGPLIFYWHGTSSSPGEAAFGIGPTQIDAILAEGGIIAAPFADPAAGIFPWFYTALQPRDDDFIVADEVLGCAIQKVGVDTRRIHTMGMSAGGLQTTQMSYRRSGYIASAVPYSGGLLGLATHQDPTNKFSAMMFHGGANDVVIISFQAATEAYLGNMESLGQFGFICNHGGGHIIPAPPFTTFDARPAVWQFFQDHPFGTEPSPYANGLPASMPAYCSL